MTKKYIPERPVGTAQAQLTFDGETGEYVTAWKNMGYNITTILIMCAWYVFRHDEVELVTGYERQDFVKFGGRVPRPLLVNVDSAAKTLDMSRSEFWDACVRTVVRDIQNGVKVPLSTFLPEPLTMEELTNKEGK